jgi:hypothetical protein
MTAIYLSSKDFGNRLDSFSLFDLLADVGWTVITLYFNLEFKNRDTFEVWTSLRSRFWGQVTRLRSLKGTRSGSGFFCWRASSCHCTARHLC